MSRSQKPTKDQLELLERLKIPAPTTKEACSNLLDYIKLKDKDREGVKKRIRKVREFHSQYYGARVKITCSENDHYGEYGRVEYLRMRSQEERERIRRDYDNPNPSLYTLLIELEKEEDVYDPEPVKQKVCTFAAPSQVKVCNRGDQLFFLF